MESPRKRAWGAPGGQRPSNADPATALPAGRRALPGRPRPKTLPRSRRPGPAWSRSARPLTGFAGRQTRAARTAAPDNAGRLVLVKDLHWLGTAVGLKRAPRIAGKADRIGRPRPPADLDPALRNVRSPGDLPAPAARIGTRTHMPTPPRTNMPAHQCETTTPHTAPGGPSETTPAGRAAPGAAPREPGAAPHWLAPGQITVSHSAWPTPSASSRSGAAGRL
jgi:hypothetical protein